NAGEDTDHPFGASSATPCTEAPSEPVARVGASARRTFAVSTRDDDIEFDFFEEPATQEASSSQRTLRRPLRPSGGNGGGDGPRRPFRTPSGFTPLLRLVGLVAFAILVVVLLVF